MPVKHYWLYLSVIAVLGWSPCYGDWKSDANARIESIRKRNAEITVVDSAGDPVPCISVQIEQIKHRFAFGTCIRNTKMGDSNYKNFILDHFEWAVCENESKWEENEKTRDSVSFATADTIYNWCNSNGITMRGHCLFWEQWGTSTHVQQWVKDLPYATYPTSSQLLGEVDERIDDAMNHFKGKFVHWDVDNEMLPTDPCTYNFYNRLGEGGRVHMYQRARLRDPNCLLFMNEYTGNSFGYYSSSEYVARYNNLVGLGAQIDGLGIQGHLEANSVFNPALYYSDVLQPLAALNRPIWVTEFDASHSDASVSADNIENYFRICFSHSKVEGIIMWGFMENQMWRPNAYLITSGGALTVRGQRYQALMDEWTTEDSNATDGSGEVSFRGFHGTYEITLSYPGQTTEVHTIELEPGETTAIFEIETDIEVPIPDTTPPTPDPMTWASYPTATGSGTITMTATTATDTDSPPVQYYFECTTDGSKTSGWQISPTYVASGLTPSTLYSFRVQARDSYSTPNVTGWSSTESATTLPPSTDIEIVGNGWGTGLSHAKQNGTNRALIFIAHEESTTGSPTVTSVTYGGRAMAKIIERSTGTSGYQNYVAAFILKEADINSADAGGAFSVSWSATTSSVSYASVFLSNVNQADPNGASDSNSTTSTQDPIYTRPLATNAGDIVIDAVTCGNLGTYTMLNGFTKGTDQQAGSNGHTGATGYKSATGANETPGADFSAVGTRQAIIGFVVKAGVAPDLPPAAPTGLTATPGNETITLNWNDNSETDLDGYNVYRSTTQGSGYGKLNVSLVSTSDYIDNTVTNGIPYYYVVTAVDNNGHGSGNSNEATATPAYQTCDDVKAGGYRLVSDLTGDCYVNYLDLDVIVDHWLSPDCTEPDNCEGADFAPTDGVVNFYDFGDFAVQWLWCNNPTDSNCTPNW